jgi:hypothetical protein
MTKREWRALGMVLSLIGMVPGCGPEPAPQPPEQTPDTTPAQDTTEAAARDTTPLVLREPSVFPHSAHRGVSCQTCHQSLTSHTTHGELSCTDCHTTPTGFATMRTLTQQECMACHHGEQHGYTCEHCHARSTLTADKVVEASMKLSAWDTSRTRALAFNHAWHADRECMDCHTPTSIGSIEIAACTTCHAAHHQVGIKCNDCHQPANEAVHREAAHRGCGGSGCHANAEVAAFPPERPICLACHVDMSEHEPGRECAVCHVMRGWSTIQTRGDR